MPNAPSSSAAARPALLVSELFPPAVGGSAVLFDNIYSKLPAGSVTVLTDDAFTGDRSASGLPLARRPLNTPWWGLAHPKGLLHHLGTARAVRATSRPGTVVHCGRILPEGVAARFARFAGGPPFVCWAHGEDLATALSSRELTLTTRWVLRKTAAAFANSENTKAFLTRFGLAPEKITVVYPGVDRRRFHPGVDGAGIRARHGIGNGPVLLSVGRLQARKGHDVAIQAVARLAAQVPDVRYLIVGDGEERKRLEDLARVHASAHVTFVGEVSESDLPKYYAASDIFLLPNRVERGDFEGFGIVFLEAAACGKPVIGGASGGVVEAVDDGRTGLLVDGARVDAVFDAIARLAASPDERRRLGDEGRRRAQDRFSWDAAAARVLAVHEAVAAR